VVNQLTLQGILERAIEKEIESQQLYRDLSQKMTNEAARDAFIQLSREEQGHEDLLKKYLRGELGEGVLKREQVLDYKIAEHLEQPKVTPSMGLKDVFLVAANREKASHAFYLSLAGVHPSGRVRSLLERLAAQELEHKRRVEFIYTEVAFPQTDGG
jgi:rubrerythrin